MYPLLYIIGPNLFKLVCFFYHLVQVSEEDSFDLGPIHNIYAACPLWDNDNRILKSANYEFVAAGKLIG